MKIYNKVRKHRDKIQLEKKHGVSFKMSLGQGLITVILFMLIFVLPSRVYDTYYESYQQIYPVSEGKVAGVSTDKITLPIDLAAINIYTIAGGISVLSSLVLFVILARDNIKKQSY